MSKQTIALAYTRPADALDEAEYQALAEALSETARGRSFLAEHARRSRSAETNILLTAIERIEAQVRPRMPAPDPLHDDLRRLLDELRTARTRVETGGAAPKVEQLAALLDLVQRRLTTLLMSSPARRQSARHTAGTRKHGGRARATAVGRTLARGTADAAARGQRRRSAAAARFCPG